MTVFGKRLSEYAQFAKVFLVLIAVVGVTRLALSLTGVPNSTAKWISVSGLMWIAVFYFAIRVHTRGFGTYKHLLPVLAILNVTGQAIIITGIAIAIFTGTDNIYSASEYAFGGDGKTWTHLGAHVLVGSTVGTLVPWAFGCLIMLATRKLFKRETGTRAEVRA